MSQKVVLRIDEALLHERAVETLISHGITPDQAVEMAFALCRAARRSATVETSIFRTAEAPNTATGHPYRAAAVCREESWGWNGPTLCGNTLPCPRHGR